MAIQFKPAERRAVGLIVGLAGSSGSGKTFSALRLATGLAGGKRFAVIDTEAGRALHYADQFDFDHADLHPPFTPEAYQEAIEAADKAGYPVIVVDSASHEWAGDGGILDMQEAELDRMAGDDWRKRESCKMAAWIKPKGQHKRMMSKLLQVRAHLILCFRAEEKVEMVKEGGKTVIRPKQSTTGLDGWMPVCEKSMPYELTLSFLLTAGRPGIPHPIKLQEQHKPYFDTAKPVDETAGERLAHWAAGDSKPAPKASQPAPEEPDPVDEWVAESQQAEIPPIVSRVDDLKAAYEACDSVKELATLEEERAGMWTTLHASEKTKLKLASARAKSRLGA